MAAVHQSMAAVHQSLPSPSAHILPIYGSAIASRSARPRAVRLISKPIHRHIWIIAGTSCCGKTTIANALARRLGAGDYIEGDDYHTASNKRKMSNGMPLTDEDRGPWLDNLRDVAVDRLRTSSSSGNVVITCSSLKAKYRDVFREAERKDRSIKVHFVFLSAPQELLEQRATARAGHFFGANMIKSQFASLERPNIKFERDALLIDCSKTEQEVEATVLARVKRVLSEDTY